jgi:hypothetical protein
MEYFTGAGHYIGSRIRLIMRVPQAWQKVCAFEFFISRGALRRYDFRPLSRELKLQ